MRKLVAYHRVSTDKQSRSGLGLEAQQAAVAAYALAHGGELIASFTETESGGKADRRVLQGALAAARKHKATLVIAKLDRLSRSVAFVSRLMETGVDFVAADMPHADKTMLHMFAVMAEWERDRISDRTKAALAAAKARGIQLGNPNPEASLRRARATRTRQADQFAGNAIPVIDAIKAAGVTTLRGIADALNARGIATSNGGRWHAKTVARVLQRTDTEAAALAA